MSQLPEDSMLRRHYLTELRNKQQAIFEKLSVELENQNIEIQPAETSLFPKHIILGVVICIVVLLII